MAALTQARMPRETQYKTISMPVNFGSGMKSFQGGIACADTTTHFVAPGVAANATLTKIGQFAENFDNTAGTAAMTVLVRLDREITVFWYDNATGGAAVSTTVGGGSFFTTCYILDDHTVTNSSSGNSAAGRVWDCNTTNGVAVQATGL